MPITDNWLSEQSTCFDTCVTSGYSKPGGVSSKTMTAPLSVAFESAERAIRVVEYYCPDHLISLFRRSCRSFSSFHYPPPRFLVLSFLSYSISKTILYPLHVATTLFFSPIFMKQRRVIAFEKRGGKRGTERIPKIFDPLTSLDYVFQRRFEACESSQAVEEKKRSAGEAMKRDYIASGFE